jgi:rare lipoprotein A
MPKKIQKGLLACLFIPVAVFGRENNDSRDSIPPGGQHHTTPVKPRHSPVKVQFGTASYYSDKFEGRKTYTDEIFSQEKLTGASNTLPMHTWVRVTNLRNNRTVVVQINDKMHPRNRRLIDLTRAAAEQLGYAGRGLTRVRVDVLKKKPAGTAGESITKESPGQD